MSTATTPMREAGPDKVLRSLPVRVARWTSAIVGFVATLLGVVFVLFPGAKPDGPPVTMRAALSQPTAEVLTYGQYLDRVDLRRSPYDASALRRRGVFIELDWSAEGYKDKALPLRWQLIDARRGEQLGRSRDISVTPEAPHDAATGRLWAPLPRGRTRDLAVQVELYDETGRWPIAQSRGRVVVD